MIGVTLAAATSFASTVSTKQIAKPLPPDRNLTKDLSMLAFHDTRETSTKQYMHVITSFTGLPDIHPFDGTDRDGNPYDPTIRVRCISVYQADCPQAAALGEYTNPVDQMMAFAILNGPGISQNRLDKTLDLAREDYDKILKSEPMDDLEVFAGNRAD
jgi:hypothetical protein